MSRSMDVRILRCVSSILVFVISPSVNIDGVLAQDTQLYFTQIRSIAEPSAVDRYQSPRLSTPVQSSSVASAKVPLVGISAANQVETEISDIQQVQFQLPAPGSSAASGGDFLNPDDGPATLGPVEETPAFPFSSEQGGEQSIQGGVGRGQETVDSGSQLRSLPLGVGSNSRELGSTRLEVDSQSSRNEGYAPFESPNLGNQYATMNNSTFVSAPSGYDATTSWGRNCVSVGASTSGTWVRPMQSGEGSAAGLVRVLNRELLANYPAVPTRPLLSFGQEQHRVVVGQGMLGQPVAYVPGQWVRNSLRYLFP